MTATCTWHALNSEYLSKMRLNNVKIRYVVIVIEFIVCISYMHGILIVVAGYNFNKLSW